MQVLVRPAVPHDKCAVLALLRSHPGLEADFDAATFVVATDGEAVVGCGRLRRHPDGALELASVATVAAAHGQGIGSRVVRVLLDGAAGPVFALAKAPGFFARFGFEPVASARLPASVRAKAEGLCASQPHTPMRRAA
jgi:N-acetylglutamate synthase-like GNAT family acetyltransferase